MLLSYIMHLGPRLTTFALDQLLGRDGADSDLRAQQASCAHDTVHEDRKDEQLELDLASSASAPPVRLRPLQRNHERVRRRRLDTVRIGGDGGRWPGSFGQGEAVERQA